MDEMPIATPSKDDCNLAMLSHLLGIFTSFVGALIIWLIKKDESPFVEQEAREALNFQITLAIAHLVAFVLWFILIGMLITPALYVLNIVLCIVGAVAASKGQRYRYPFAIRLVN